MALELKQSVKLAQQTIMTPQLQQSIKLLQLSRLELTDVVRKEILENPVLEDVHNPSDGEDFSSFDSTKVPESDKTNEVMSGADAENLGARWEEYIRGGGNTGASRPGSDDEERFSLENRLVKKESLHDHLMWQLRLSNFTETEMYIGGLFIGNIDGGGYLRVNLVDITEMSGVDEAMVEGVLRCIQEFDPIGVGARDLKECLLIQAKHFSGNNPLVEAILANHLPDLENKRFSAIAKELDVSLECVVEAVKLISELEPKPGRYFNEDDPEYIIPDIYVYKEEDEFRIILNEDGMPKLRISPFYRNALSKGNFTSPTTKEYVQEKIRSAMWLIKSIHQRQRTIYKVMSSIVTFQNDFFEDSLSSLKPLALKDIAEDIGMHESTISRVTTNKYVHTSQGIFELKYFFNSSIGCLMGENIASQTVKDKIKQIVLTENPKKPYSDQKIVELLWGLNINIARRTVTKYREMLNILPSSKRKKVF